MLKFTCIVLCVVAASLTKVTHAATDEDKSAIREVIAPIIAECAADEGVSEEEIEKAKEAHDPKGLKSCFLGCILKKIEALDSKGMFDADTVLSKFKQFVKSEEDFAKFEKIGKDCMSVNEKPVSDGEAGCDRAQLIVDCFKENNADMSF